MVVLKKYHSSIFVLMILFGAISIDASGQNYVFAQLSGTPINTSGWILTGSAIAGNLTGTGNSEIILVPATTQATGAIYYSTPINAVLCNKWTAEFDFRIFDGNAADGISFWYLDVPPTGFVNGQGLGIPGTANGLKIGFDTYNNCGGNPPSTDMPKIEIRWGIGYSECWAQPTTQNAFGLLSFIRSTSYNRAKVTYDNGSIKVYVNNTLYVSGTQSLTFPGYFGFSASVGDQYDNHSIKNVVIYVDKPPSAAGNDTTICSNGIAQIGAGSDPTFTYSWTPSSGLSNSIIGNPTVNIPNNLTVPINHQYIVATSKIGSPSCASTDTVIITVLPQIVTSINKTICQGQSFEGYNATGIFIDTLVNVNGCDSIRTLNLIVTAPVQTSINEIICEGNSYLGYTVTGNYVDTFLNVNGCDSIRTLNLIVNSITYSTINKSICQGQSFLGYNNTGTYIDTLINVNGCDSIRTLNLSIVSTLFTNIDSTICQGQTVLGYNTTGTYVDSLSSTAGCDSIRTLNLIVIPNPNPTFTISPSSGCPPLSVQFNNTSTQQTNVNYVWNFGEAGTGGQPNTSHTYLTTGSYTVSLTGTNNNGCIGTATNNQTVTVFSMPSASFNTSPDPNIFGNSSIQFNNTSIGASSWMWNFGDGIGVSNNQNPNYSYPNAGNYSIVLIVKTDNNCLDTTYGNITIYPLDGIFIPNAFSPNEDGLNENFGVSGLGIRNVEIYIYNRYGSIIYKGAGPNAKWNGKMNGTGRKCNQGNYIYLIKLIDPSGNSKLYKGNLILIR